MREDLVAARDEHVRRFHDAHLPLYPTWRGRTYLAADIHHDVEHLTRRAEPVTVAGRMRGRREHGGSVFLDVWDASGKLQVLVRRDAVGAESFSLLGALDPGDILAATGKVLMTRAGEVTVDAAVWTLLAKSRVPIPDTWYGLQDVERRARERELDLVVNEEAREAFRLRSQLTALLRTFLTQRGFMEVETPILQPIAGGASARPFVTRHHALGLDLTLRISPELYLKRLIVGGYERVFEIAKNFRNEGVDRQHNPEFTMCEFYMAYASVDDLVPLTAELFTEIFTTLRGGLEISYQGKRLNMAPPWKEVRFVDAMKDATGVDVLETDTPEPYLAVLARHRIPRPEVTSVPVLLDTLYKETIRKRTWDPVIVRDFPVVMEPLAKRREDEPRLVQRVQLIAAGMELLKAYTELNDPDDQEQRFREQRELRAGGDAEAQEIDPAFLHALRIGLPPTAGWGLGVDRLAMLVADRAHIRDVIAFPLLRPEHQQE